MQRTPAIQPCSCVWTALTDLLLLLLLLPLLLLLLLMQEYMLAPPDQLMHVLMAVINAHRADEPDTFKVKAAMFRLISIHYIHWRWLTHACIQAAEQLGSNVTQRGVRRAAGWEETVWLHRMASQWLPRRAT